MRPLVEKVVNTLLGDANLVVAILPTGYGKTTAFEYGWKKGISSLGRFIHTLPLRSIVETVAQRFRKSIGEEVVYQAHTFVESVPKSSFFCGKYVVTTLDSFSLNFYGVPVAEMLRSRWHSDLAFALARGANVVFDEAHMLTVPDTEEGIEKGEGQFFKVLAIIIDVLRAIIGYGFKGVILTATMSPTILKYIVEQVKQFVGDRLKCSVILYAPDGHGYLEAVKKYLDTMCTVLNGVDEGFEKVFSNLSYRVEFVFECRTVSEIPAIVEELASHRKIAIFVNTVSTAEKVFDILNKRVDDRPVLLLHSRIPQKARYEIISKLFELNKYVLISTQVMEAGVDISFDAAISSFCSPFSAIQRIGRVCRYGGRGDEKCEAVFINIDGDGVGTVYDAEIVESFIDYAKSNTAKLGDGVRWRIPFVEGPDYLSLLLHIDGVVERKIGSGDGVGSYMSGLRELAEPVIRKPRDILENIDNRFRGSLIRSSSLISATFVESSILKSLASGECVDIDEDKLNEMVTQYSIPLSLENLNNQRIRNVLAGSSEDKLVVLVAVKMYGYGSKPRVSVCGVEMELQRFEKKPLTTLSSALRKSKSIAGKGVNLDEYSYTEVELIGIAGYREKLKVVEIPKLKLQVPLIP